MNIKPIDGVYRFRVDDAKCLLTTSGNGDNAMTWHRCLGHINYNDLCKMRNGLVDGIKFTNADEDIKQCEACMKAKQTRLPFQPSDKRAGNTLDIIHSDLCGPMETPSIGKARYFLTFIDDHSRKIFVYFLRCKSEVSSKFEEFKALVENQIERNIKVI